MKKAANGRSRGRGGDDEEHEEATSNSSHEAPAAAAPNQAAANRTSSSASASSVASIAHDNGDDCRGRTAAASASTAIKSDRVALSMLENSGVPGAYLVAGPAPDTHPEQWGARASEEEHTGEEKEDDADEEDALSRRNSTATSTTSRSENSNRRTVTTEDEQILDISVTDGVDEDGDNRQIGDGLQGDGDIAFDPESPEGHSSADQLLVASAGVEQASTVDDTTPLEAFTVGEERVHSRLEPLEIEVISTSVLSNSVSNADATESRFFRKVTDVTNILLFLMVVCAILVPVLVLVLVSTSDNSSGDEALQPGGDTWPFESSAAPSAPPTGHPSKSPLPTATPSFAATTSERFALLKSSLGSMSSEADLSNPLSPQYQALSWLADEDERRLDATDVGRLIQRYALATLYFATGGGLGSWIRQCNFLSSDHECSWNCNSTGINVPQANFFDGESGVFCSPAANESVTLIEIVDANLTGTIPCEIGYLHSLEHLNLGFNRLSGSLPTTVGYLTNMSSLVLSWNVLVGTIPEESSRLDKLDILYLNGNLLDGSLPFKEGNLPSLRFAWLFDNCLSGSIAASITNISTLQDVALHKNSLTGTIPTDVGCLSSLSLLTLNDNKLNGTLPPSLGDLTRLLALDVGRNHLSGTLPSSLGNLQRSAYTSFQYNRLSGSIPSELGQLTSTMALLLQGNHFEGTIPSELVDIPYLIWLDVSGNRLNGTVPSFQQMFHVQTPYLSTNMLLLHNNDLTGNISDPYCTYRHTANSSSLACDNACTDLPGWYDADGPLFDCGFYAIGNNCALFGDFFENNGYTANEACCACKCENNMETNDILVSADCLPPQNKMTCGCCSYCCDQDANCEPAVPDFLLDPIDSFFGDGVGRPLLQKYSHQRSGI